MVQGIYTTASGMIPRVNQERNIANNLANQNTNGYKKSSIFLRQLITAQYALDHAMGIERTEVPEDFRIDFTQGTLDKTDMPYDIALNGSGFLRVRDNAGDIYYTRNGRFYLDQDGFMINSSGMFLLNNIDSAIRIQGRDMEIQGNGDVYEEGVRRNTIGFIDFDVNDYQALFNLGRGLFTKPPAVNEIQPEPDTLVLQGFLEDSNVKPILAMVDMIDIFRTFELGQKSIQIQDQTLQKVVTEVGVVR